MEKIIRQFFLSSEQDHDEVVIDNMVEYLRSKIGVELIIEAIEGILFTKKHRHQHQIRKLKKTHFFLPGIDRPRL